MFASVIGKLSFCNRREQKASSPTKKHATAGSVGKKQGFQPFDDSDAGKSTDIGDLSHTDTLTGSSDGSDMETRRVPNSAKVKMQPAPGLIAPPPGLDAPPGLTPLCSGPIIPTPSSLPGKRLNSQAAMFVPSFSAPPEEQSSSQQLRQSIRRVKGALEEWEAEHLSAPHPTNFAGSVQDNTILALQEAISKLSPQEAAVVRNLLTSKEADGSVSRMLGSSQQWAEPHMYASQQPFFPPGHFSRPTGIEKVPTHRTFTPFGTKYGKPAKPAKVQRPGPALDDDGDDSLRTNLRDLAQLDSTRVLMVRKINRLGLESVPALEAYFAKFGSVERMMVSHSRSKATNGQTRIRPATLGFVVFGKADEVQAVLACGAEHVIQGVSVVASAFESHPV